MSDWTILFSLVLLLALFYLFLYFKNKRREIKSLIALKKLENFFEESSNPFDLNHFVFEGKDYKRKNKIERRFKRRYFFELLEEFNHQCFKCQKEVKTECDHFFIPKSYGGNLMVRHKEGFWVCNTVLLCRKCNRLKADKLPKDFFSTEELKKSLVHVKRLSELINKRELS